MSENESLGVGIISAAFLNGEKNSIGWSLGVIFLEPACPKLENKSSNKTVKKRTFTIGGTGQEKLAAKMCEWGENGRRKGVMGENNAG